MRRVLWGLLMTAGAILPGLASAQDGDRPDRGSRRELRADVTQGDPAPQPQRVERADQNDGQRRGGDGQGWQRSQQQPQPAAAPQQARDDAAQRQNWSRADGGGRRSDADRGDGGRRWQNRPQQQFRPADQTTPAPPQFGNGNAGGAQRSGWRGGNGAGRPAWNGDTAGQRIDGDRGNGGRPDWQNAPGRDVGGNGLNGRPNGAFDRNDPRLNGRINDRRDDQRRSPSTGWQRDRADWNDHNRDDRRFDARSSWNRGWRDDRRYDWNRYRSVNRGAYHLPRYYAPYGWDGGYRRFSVGIRLSSILFAQNYWIDDPWDYRLPPADFPYRWVRYYDDALLVDVRYGQVVDVVYGIFW